MSTILLEKFNNIIATSRVFKLMSEAEQAQLLASFQNASDDQLAEAIKAIEDEDKKFTAAEHAQLEQAQKQIETAEKLQAGLKAAERNLLASEESDEQKDNLQALATMESQLAGKDKSNDKKKFLGVF